jgi:hypothetical protein
MDDMREHQRFVQETYQGAVLTTTRRTCHSSSYDQLNFRSTLACPWAPLRANSDLVPRSPGVTRFIFSICSYRDATVPLAVRD